MMLFNSRITHINDVEQFADENLKVTKKLQNKIEKKILEQTDKYLTENQFTLIADKTEMLLFTNINSDPIFKGEVIKPAHACRYLGVQNDSDVTFENQLKSVLSKMANAIRSLYLVKNHFPLKVRGIFSICAPSLVGAYYLHTPDSRAIFLHKELLCNGT